MQEPIEYPSSYFLSDDEMMDAYSSGDEFGDMDEFQTACANGNVDAVENMINSGNAKFCSMTPHKYTPLILAAFNGHLPVVSTLIKHNADVNFGGGSQASPLSCAIRKVQNDVVHALLDAKADISQATIEGKSMVALSISTYNFEIANHLIKKGAPIDCDNFDYNEYETRSHGSALYAAVIVGNLEMVRTVLSATSLDAEIATTALAAASEDSAAGQDGSIFNVIFAEMKKHGLITEQCLHSVLAPVFKKKKLVVLNMLVDVAKDTGIDLMNTKVEFQGPWIFYYCRFKKDIQQSFQKACGAGEGDDVDVSAYPLSVAVFCGWTEGVQALFCSSSAAHEQARGAAQLCDKVTVYEQAQEACK